MNDPVQMLIDAGAIPTSPFGPSSRYAGLAIVTYQASPDAPRLAYVSRRFAPQRADVAIAAEHTVRAGDRIDLLAAHYLGDAELHWRIADANVATDMLALTATLGALVSIPTPPGFAGT
jgi:hypothetical protein